MSFRTITVVEVGIKRMVRYRDTGYNFVLILLGYKYFWPEKT